MRDRIKKILKEEDDFDWIRQQNPATKEFIIDKFNLTLSDYGYHARTDDKFIDTVHELALTNDDIVKLFKSLDRVFDNVNFSGMEDGQQQAWEEAYEDGRREGYSEAEDDLQDEIERELRDELTDDLEDKMTISYNEGHDDGMEEGYRKGYTEAEEEIYHKAFEEGRAYESGKDVEYYERGESTFNFGEDEYEELD